MRDIQRALDAGKVVQIDMRRQVELRQRCGDNGGRQFCVAQRLWIHRQQRNQIAAQCSGRNPDELILRDVGRNGSDAWCCGGG